MDYIQVENGEVKGYPQPLPQNWADVSNFYLLEDERVRQYGWYPLRFVPAEKTENDVVTGQSFVIEGNEVVQYEQIRPKTQTEIENENSIVGLNTKIQRLEEIISIKQEEVQSYIDAQIEHEAFIDSIASDNLKKDDEIIQKDESINQLNQTITTTLSELESNVANQINNINSALDTLSQNVSSQCASKNASQDSEIAALKSQIAALQVTINSLRSSSGGGSTSGGTSTGTRLSATGSASTVGRNNPAGAGRPGL